MKTIVAKVLIAATLWSCLSCRDSSTGPLAACTGAVNVQVAISATPRFSWAPRCGVDFLEVISAPGNNVPPSHWRIQSDASQIGPDVTYGVAPTGTQTLVPAHAITSGQDYTVSLRMSGASAPVGIGSWRAP